MNQPTSRADARLDQGKSNAVLESMLDRLYTSLLSGPALNCKPHRSRQRVDWAQLADLQDISVDDAMRALLDEDGEAKLSAQVLMPEHIANHRGPRGRIPDDGDAPDVSAEQREQASQWRKQQGLLNKLRSLTQDANTYEQDTGVHALGVGYPLLSIPPSVTGGRRILAPIAMIPTDLLIKSGGKPGITIRCAGNGNDRVIPNPALIAWVERETGQRLPDDLLPPNDDAGEDPWREINELVQMVCERLEIDVPELPRNETVEPDDESETDTDASKDQALESSRPRQPIEPTPLAEAISDRAQIVESAVLGLFPSSKQGLLRDTRDMLKDPPLPGAGAGASPAAAFVHPGVPLDAPTDHEVPDNRYESERFVTLADPFQAQTVKLVQTHTGLVMHGPPGTGKSQTITNIIGDHLARGQRVLFVCEKRTALDVVFNRLKHLGLDELCATVHDPQRDQRDLYMSIRAQLEMLTDRKTHPKASKRVEKYDESLQAIHNKLTDLHAELMEPDETGTPESPGSPGISFHESVGRWLSIQDEELDHEALKAVTLADLEAEQDTLTRLFSRAIDLDWPSNPWAKAATREASALDRYLAKRPDDVRSQIASAVETAQTVDRTQDLSIPEFDLETPLDQQAERRTQLLAQIKATTIEHLSRLSKLPDTERATLAQRAGVEQDRIQEAKAKPLDRELTMAIKGEHPSLRSINESLGTLRAFHKAVSSWTGFFAFGIKKQGKQLLSTYGLASDAASANRLIEFLEGFKDRIVLTALHAELTGTEPTQATLPDEQLFIQLDQLTQALLACNTALTDPSLGQRFLRAIDDENTRSGFLEGLERSAPRAEAIIDATSALQTVEEIDRQWIIGFDHLLRQGKSAPPTLQTMQSGANDIDPVLRLLADINALPQALQQSVADLCLQSTTAEQAIDALSKTLLGHHIRTTIANKPELLRVDAHDLSALFDQFRNEQDGKREKVRDAIEHAWVQKQKDRLLVGTGSRLNSLGASTRQRLFVRGKRAMRLRQVIHLGQNTSYEDGGDDPLFDLRPVWLCSPETVAQVLPREPLFDVLIFDEASQLRLEEALPVLTRAKRVVIAGDPKQLPPTRFFEAAVADSGPQEIETEDDLFEAQQSEAEDLLSAALNLSVEESHLNVHYRSLNADLIGFSNEYFYGGRLQAIPGHPANIAKTPPLQIKSAQGIYEKGLNPIEADAVINEVERLLDTPQTPSIGIATFNVAQRDLIIDKLNERADENSKFASKLDKARNRSGNGSFEGLFVKNLENVQGDERDVIIISTTYGKNAQGKFYRRFGPLGMPGGGRRLNVLVTRARQKVLLVTSIPPESYRTTEPIPEGVTPSGGWLLFAYLRYAEQIQALYDGEESIEAQDVEPSVTFAENSTQYPSPFVHGLAFAAHQETKQHTQTYWGNDGFCVDIALQTNGEVPITHGVLTDFTRFDGAPDPVEWDIYRTGILNWQGWDLKRVWTPHFVRDPEQALQALAENASLS